MMDNNMRNYNKHFIESDEKYLTITNRIGNVRSFLNSFSFLTLGRDNIVCKHYVFTIQSIFLSTELTAGSILDCCKNCCIADANTLLRKYRDDLFFCLYIIVYSENKKLMVSKGVDVMESNIEKWLQNSLSDLSINEVLKQIGSKANISDAVRKYHLQSSFSEIGDKLNNYVHSNGYLFYNRNVTAYRDDELLSSLEEISRHTYYITTVFLFLLILCSPLFVMATDYIDYLECGLVPCEGSQYLVAPFVEEFIQQNIGLIDKNCYSYLQENTSMVFR